MSYGPKPLSFLSACQYLVTTPLPPAEQAACIQMIATLFRTEPTRVHTKMDDVRTLMRHLA